MLIEVSLLKTGYFILAWVSLFLGIIGVILPLLPTTPFMLLAAFGFSKSSSKFHRWLISHSIFGKMITNWEQGGVINLKTKITATIFVIVMLSISFYFISMNNIAKAVVMLTVIVVFTFIWLKPSQLRKK